MPRDSNRSGRLEARIAPDSLAIVKRAAELQGRSASDFMVDDAQEEAIRAIVETEIIRLSINDQRRFAEALINPPDANDAYPLGLSANVLAQALRVPGNCMSDSVRRRRDVSANAAICLGRYFEVDPRFWLNLQTACDLSRAETDNDYSGLHRRAEIEA